MPFSPAGAVVQAAEEYKGTSEMIAGTVIEAPESSEVMENTSITQDAEEIPAIQEAEDADAYPVTPENAEEPGDEEEFTEIVAEPVAESDSRTTRDTAIEADTAIPIPAESAEMLETVSDENAQVNLLASDSLPGDGTQDSPYLVSTEDDLRSIDNNLSASYTLSKSITLTAENWTPIGVSSPFSGTFDGNGHTISALTLSGINYVGLFGLRRRM